MTANENFPQEEIKFLILFSQLSAAYVLIYNQLEAKWEKLPTDRQSLMVQTAQADPLLIHDRSNLLIVQLSRSTCYFCFYEQFFSFFLFTPSFWLHTLISHFFSILMR
jgi:hypothetical protein